MRLEHYPVVKLQKEIRQIIERHLPGETVELFFFGSRVTGKGNERSDVDVGLRGAAPVPLETMAKMREALENLSTLYKVQIVDFNRASEEFREVALEQTELF